jgi:lipoprotein-releasing system permease protein
MAYPTFIGSRYLRSRKKKSISAIGVIAIAGVALGVASLSIVISISSGFQEEFTDKVLAVNSHVLVMKYGVDFSEYRKVIADIKKMPEVHGVEPFVIQEMMISHKNKTAGVLLKGIDPGFVAEVLDLPSQITNGTLDGLRVPGSAPPKSPQGRNPAKPMLDQVDEAINSLDAGVPDETETKAAINEPLPGIVVGEKLAETLEVKLGDVVQITTPLIGLDVLGWSPSNDTPRTLRFKVIGMFYAGFLEYDTKLAYVDYFQAQRFFNHGDSVTGIELTLHDRDKASTISKQIKKNLGRGPYHTIDWMTLNEPLFTALKMQKVVLTLILAVIVGVAAFNIIATLVMMVFDKRREIAILKSMGATRPAIAQIFLHVGLVVGLVGIAIGLAVGIGVCLLLQEVGWPLDPKVYLIDHLPVRIDAIDFVVAAGVAFLICQLATILPALSASKLNPVDGLNQD